MGGEVSRFVEEIDERYIETPRRKQPTMPSSLWNIGKPQQPAKKKVQSTFVQHGPAVPNNPAQIGAIMPGMKVQHDKFGIGKVIAVEGTADSRKATVFFEGGVGNKQLMLKFAKLTIIDN